MEIEAKAEYYHYIKEMERMGIAYAPNCTDELKKRFPELNEAKAERLVNLYVKEEIEPKKNLLLG